MAVNHADGTLFASVIIYPIVAACVAFGHGARWTTPLFFIAGLAIGVFVVTTSRFLLYSVMGRIMASKMLQAEDRWSTWIVGGPLLLAYLALPITITCAGICTTYYASLWAVGRLTFP